MTTHLITHTKKKEILIISKLITLKNELPGTNIEIEKKIRILKSLEKQDASEWIKMLNQIADLFK